MQYLNLSMLGLKFYQHKEQIMTVYMNISFTQPSPRLALAFDNTKKHATACLIVPFVNFLKKRLSLVWQLSIKHLAK